MLEPLKLMSLAEVAEMIGVTQKTIANRIAKGDVPGHRTVVGGRWHIEGAVAYALRSGLKYDHLKVVAEIVKSHRSDPQLATIVAEYVKRHEVKK